MNKKLEKELFETYKELFVYKDDLRQSVMGFGFECSDGWYPLIKSLCALIHSKVKNHNKRVDTYNRLVREKSDLVETCWKGFDNTKVDFPQVEQVKEKFGGLRFYTGGISPQISDSIFGAISLAEMMSYHICEECGNKGKLREKLSWIRTLCDECYKTHVEKISKRFKKLKEKELLGEEK